MSKISVMDFLSPLPACGERPDGIADDIRVRGTLLALALALADSPPHPDRILTMRSDLSPQAGRGDGVPLPSGSSLYPQIRLPDGVVLSHLAGAARSADGARLQQVRAVDHAQHLLHVLLDNQHGQPA